MISTLSIATLAFAGALLQPASAHMAAWTKGMYCLGGPQPGSNNMNNDAPAHPLYELTKADWFFQHSSGCDRAPPANGSFLEIPANGEFTVEIASNRAFTSFGNSPPANTGINGIAVPYAGATGASVSGDGCITNPNLHTTEAERGAGTAFAISYHSDLSQVTMENLVVFSVAYNTPYLNKATYKVPDLPECPPGGCTCAWLWAPNGCGIPNMYMQGHKCVVTGARASARSLAAASPPTSCKNDPSLCVKGAKQAIVFNQKDGNTAAVLDGVTPQYNKINGFADGAQTDIFGQQQAPAGYGEVKSTGYGEVKSAGYGEVKSAGYGEVQSTGYGEVQSTGYAAVTSSAGYATNTTAGYAAATSTGYATTTIAGYAAATSATSSFSTATSSPSTTAAALLPTDSVYASPTPSSTATPRRQKCRARM